jgi:hypothetical protein
VLTSNALGRGVLGGRLGRAQARLGAVGAIVALSLWPALPAGAAVDVSGSGGSIDYSVGGGSPGAAGSGAAPGPSALGTGGFAAYVPTLSTAPVGSACYQVSAQAYPSQALANAITAAYWQQWSVLVGRYPACPSAASPALAAWALAASWWLSEGRDLLPRPSPWVAPGYALAGHPGYLEARVQLRPVFDNPTPLGDLRVAAWGQVWVDWGDAGGWQGPFATAGGPWPDGTLTHTWDWAGTYDLKVQVRWGATWALAGQTGQLGGLATDGELPGFQVRQLEAVLNR